MLARDRSRRPHRGQARPASVQRQPAPPARRQNSAVHIRRRAVLRASAWPERLQSASAPRRSSARLPPALTRRKRRPVMVAAAEGEMEEAKRLLDAVPRRHPFALRYTASLPALDWSKCEQVLNRLDLIEALKRPWSIIQRHSAYTGAAELMVCTPEIMASQRLNGTHGIDRRRSSAARAFESSPMKRLGLVNLRATASGKSFASWVRNAASRISSVESVIGVSGPTIPVWDGRKSARGTSRDKRAASSTLNTSPPHVTKTAPSQSHRVGSYPS